MKFSVIFLLLVVVAAALAFPERPARRFFPRRKQNEVATPQEEESEKVVVEEPVTPRFRIGGVSRKNLASKKAQDAPKEDQPSTPRFRIGGRPSGSSFTPRKSLSSKQTVDETPSAGRPLKEVEEILSARPPLVRPAAIPATASRAPAAATRTRGSISFIESLKLGTIPVEPSQIEELEKLQKTGGRAPSRAPSRAPAAASRPVSRVSSRRSFSKPSTVAPPPAPVEEMPVTPAEERPSKSSGSVSDKELRRQRLVQLKRRPRIGGANVEATSEKPKMADDEMVKEMPEKVLMPEKEQLSDNQINDVTQGKASGQDTPKLDVMEEQAIDETLKEETALKPKGKPTKKNIPKVETSSQSMSEDAPPALDADDSPIKDTVDSEASTTTTTTTTTEAPKRRGGTTLKRLRNSRPLASSEPRSRSDSSGRQRTRDPPASPGANDTPAPVRTSSRRGGRGNSRGGAAVAAAAAAGSARTVSSRAGSTRTASTRTRGPSSRGRAPTPVAETLEAAEESVRSSKPLIRRRRQFQSLSARLARRARPAIASSRRPTAQEVQQDPKEEPAGPSEVTVTDDPQIVKPIPGRLTPRRVTGNRPSKRNNLRLGADRKSRRKLSRTLVQRLRNRQRQQQAGGLSQQGNPDTENERLPLLDESETVDQAENEKTGGVSRPGRQRGRTESSSQHTKKPQPQKDVEQTRAPKSKDNLKPQAASKPVNPRVRGARLSTLRPNFRRRFKTRVVTTESHLSLAAPEAESSTAMADSPTTTTVVDDVDVSTTTTSTTTSSTIPLTTESPTTPTTIPTMQSSEIAIDSFDATTLVSDVILTTEPSLPTASSIPIITIAATPEAPKLVRNRLRRVRTRTRASTEAPLEMRNKVRGPSEATTPFSTTTTTTIPPTTTSISTTPSTTSTTSTTPSTTSTTSTTPSTTSTSTTPSTTSTTTTTPSTTRSTTTTSSSTTTLRTTPSTTTLAAPTTTEKWVPKVAPEDPQNAVNRGGFRFRIHEDSEKEIRRHRGEVVLTEVGRLEDTPPAEVKRILAGLGGRRRGLARPPSGESDTSTKKTTTTTTTPSPPLDEADYYEYYYDE